MGKVAVMAGISIQKPRLQYLQHVAVRDQDDIPGCTLGLELQHQGRGAGDDTTCAGSP